MSGRRMQMLRGGVGPHSGNEGQGGLLTVLESSQQQEEVLLLVDQGLTVAVRPQVFPLQTLDLDTKQR